MTSCERIKRTLNFKIPDRIGIYDCLWDETRENWHRQNFIPDKEPYQDFFDYDLRLFEFDQSFLLMEKQLEAGSDSAVIINSYGVTEQRWKNKSGASRILDIAVRDRQKWNDFKAFLTPCRSRIDSSFENEYKAAKEKGRFLTLAFCDPFGHAMNIFGLENLLALWAQDRAFLEDVFSVSADLSMGMHQLLKDRGFIFDGVWLWSDLAYKNGCYFSRESYKVLLHPYHKKLCHYFNSKDMPVIFHSDGNMLEFVPLLLKAGVRALNPLELDCGFDIDVMKSKYGADLVLFGGMPAAVLEEDKKRIESILSRCLEGAKKGGGFIYHTDKPVGPAVSFDNYKFALEMVKKYGSYN